MTSAQREKLFSGRSMPTPKDRLTNLIEERNALQSTSNLIDQACALSAHTSNDLHSQGQTLTHAKSNVDQIIGSIPYIGELSKKVLVKKKRDRIVLGSLIGFLMFVLVWYMFG